MPSRNTAEAIEFLQSYSPNAPVSLTAIKPDTPGAASVTLHPLSDRDLLFDWIEVRQGTHNMYFSVNPSIRIIKGADKAKKEDVRGARWLHVDIDPRANEDIAAEKDRALTQLQQSSTPPSVVIDSGGGIQAFWRLNQEYETKGNAERIEYIESRNRKLALDFSGDNCFNIDRIMRLPGTINVPNKSKLKKGRVATTAKLLNFVADRSYDVAAFEEVPNSSKNLRAPVRFQNEEPKSAKQISSIDEVVTLQGDKHLSLRHLIVHGFLANEPNRYSSRSEPLFAAVIGMCKAGCDDPTMLGIVTNPAFRISESVREKGKNAHKYALRQIERARDKTSDFDSSKSGEINQRSQKNIRIAMSRLGFSLSYDEFARRTLIQGADERSVRQLEDGDIDSLWLLIDSTFNFRPTFDFFFKVVTDTARQNRFHPVRDYLDSLVWDGKSRISTWLIDNAGAENTPYIRAVSRIFLIAAVRRIRQPGVKFDEMLVLEGPQGTLKSSALRALAVRPEWFNDGFTFNLTDKEIVETITGSWIVEAAELKGLRGAEFEHMKSVLSRQSDSARVAYARTSCRVPRQWLLAGTMNPDHENGYLRDPTGNRRIWPVTIQRFDLEGFTPAVPQLWAEASAAEAAGESTRLPEELWSAALEEQNARVLIDPWDDVLEDALAGRNGKIRSKDVWVVLNIPPAQRDQRSKYRMGQAMRRLGWRKTKLRFEGSPEHAYARGTSMEQECPLYAARDTVPPYTLHVWVEGEVKPNEAPDF